MQLFSIFRSKFRFNSSIQIRRFSFEGRNKLRDVWKKFGEKVIENKMLSGGIAFIASVVTIYSFLNDNKKDAMRTIERLTFSIQNAEITHSRSSHFVSRPNIEKKINAALTTSSLDADSYTIVYGPKGIGKTELVDHAAIGKKGVVKVLVSSANTRDDVIQSITKKLFGGATHSDLDIDVFKQAIKKCGVIPTIIFEVERSVSPTGSRDHVVDAVRSLSKELAHCCRCIIVLSEANAVLQFGKDDREEYIYVDEMEREEAKQLLKALGRDLTEAEMEYVFTNIGSSPLNLIKLSIKVSPVYSVHDFVANVLRNAEKQLAAFPHKPILKALKDHPEGVTPKSFHNQKDDGIDLTNPAAVGIAMKSINAIVYRMELDMYTLMSTAHRTALKSYDPMVKKYYFF